MSFNTCFLATHTGSVRQLLIYSRAAVPAHAPDNLPDREHLDRFARSGDEASFAALGVRGARNGFRRAEHSVPDSPDSPHPDSQPPLGGVGLLPTAPLSPDGIKQGGW